MEEEVDASDEQITIAYSMNRQVIYKQLVHFFSYPKMELINYFQNESLEEHNKCYRHLGIASDKNIKKIISWINKYSDNQTVLRELEIEYTYLFVTAYPKLPAPPYGSIYLEKKGMVWGDTTADAYKLYTEAGLIISEDFHNIPDHIAAELEFVWYLLREELKAKERKDDEQCLKMSSIQSQFLTNHLLKWVPSFLSKVIESARIPFYREISDLAIKFIEKESQYGKNSIV